VRRHVLSLLTLKIRIDFMENVWNDSGKSWRNGQGEGSIPGRVGRTKEKST